MRTTPVDSATVEALLAAFCARLSGALPFREDSALIADLLVEVRPVLEGLARGIQIGAGEPSAQHEGFALLRLLFRRVALQGATPTAALALTRALEAALNEGGFQVPERACEHLAIVALEGYCAGRDERHEETLRALSAASQLCFALAPRCYVVCLSGCHHLDQLDKALDDIARELFRGDAKAAALDVARLQQVDEESARALVGFASTLRGLGTQVLLSGASAALHGWFEQLKLDALRVERFEELSLALPRLLALGGYEVKARGRLLELMKRVRSVR
jgi:anti-anti-sigma regulatory factor